MISSVRRAALAAVVGGLTAALSLVAAYVVHPGLVFEMDRPLPSFIHGIYGPEVGDQGTFAWSSGHVVVAIPGLDRQVDWSCTIRLRGARAEGLEQPRVEVSVDGRRLAGTVGTNEFQDFGILLPADEQVTGASIVIDVSPTFVPGGADTRELGMQIDRFVCRPRSSILRPPANALSQAAVAAAVFSAGLALVGLSLSSALFVAIVIGLGQTVMMAVGSGIYGSYPGHLPGLALGVVIPVLLLARTLEVVRREPLSSSARFVMAACASVLFLKIAGLLHPAKPIIDAVFNAHRFDAVLSCAFTHVQPLPNGVQMPYAIGLYVFAAPWAWLTADHVALVRIVTAATDAIGGALLYPVVLRAWGDRRSAALSAVLFQLVPLPFAILGNANLTNMFAQSMALLTIVAAASWPLDRRHLGAVAAVTALTTWAFCSHVSTITILSATLGALVVLFFWRGDAARRRAAFVLAATTAAALVISWLLFYRHFLDVFRHAFTQMFSAPTPEQAATVVIKGNMTMGERIVDLGAQIVSSFGWPLLILAAAGVWSLVRRGRRDRLESALLAWAAVWVVFSFSTVFARVDEAYVRYTAEFLGRINLATVPLAAILGARGAAAAWQPDVPAAFKRPLQLGTIVLIAAVVWLATEAWLYWFQR